MNPLKPRTSVELKAELHRLRDLADQDLQDLSSGRACGWWLTIGLVTYCVVVLVLLICLA